MRLLIKKFGVIAIAILAAILVRDVVRSDVLTRIGSVEWAVSHSAPLAVSFALQSRYPDRTINYKWSRNEREKVGVSVISFKAAHTPKTLFTTKFEGAEDQWIIDSVRIDSSFGRDLIFRGQDILDRFFAPGSESDLSLVNGQIILSTRGDFGEVFSREAIRLSNPALEMGLPLVVGLVVFLLLSYIPIGGLPSIRQLRVDSSSGGSHSLELDGLRGFAAIFVVADHTWGMFSGSGLFGVWIFFALSGYLLSIPFVKEPERGLDIGYIGAFYIRRLARILPMYYFVIFVFFLGNQQVHLALSHFLFLQGNGHLWTIVQEMLFYLMLPGVTVLMALLVRLGVVVAFGVLLLVTLLAIIYYQLIPIELFSDEDIKPPFFGWFLVGIVVSYLCHGEVIEKFINVSLVAWFEQRRLLSHLVGVVALVLLFGLVGLASTQFFAYMHGPYKSYADVYNGWYAVAAGFLIFAAVVARSSLYGMILRFMPLRSFGVLGYSVYLLHPMMMEVVMKTFRDHHLNPPNGVVLFLIVLAVTWVVSTVTYNLIEYPFLSYRVGAKKSLAEA